MAGPLRPNPTPPLELNMAVEIFGMLKKMVSKKFFRLSLLHTRITEVCSLVQGVLFYQQTFVFQLVRIPTHTFLSEKQYTLYMYVYFNLIIFNDIIYNIKAN